MTSDVRQDQDPAGSRACDIIASNGLRITNQRVALLKVLLESEDHPDAVELYRRLRASDASISLATVYRNLASLEKVGVAERHYFEGHGAGVVNLTRWRRGNGLFWSVRCSRRPSKRRRLRFDDSVLRLRNGGWRELRNGFGRQCGRLQTVATRPESEILACNALVFETVDGCFPPCCSSPCGNDVRDRMRLHVWPLRRIAACL